MLVNNRVIWNDGGTLRDLSVSMNDLFALSQVVDILAGEVLYLGSELPFNHRHFQVTSANAAASAVTVAHWTGSDWADAVDVLDLTKGSGSATLAQSGIIQWTTDRNKSWNYADTTETVTGLETLKIYSLYWVRLTFSGNLTGTTALSYVGHKFSKDAQLGGYWPDLNRSSVKTAFEAGKLNWDDQHILAAEEIITDLRKLRVIESPNQIAAHEMFSTAAVHKVAEIIYSAFGEKYEENRDLARERYEQAMTQLSFPNVDKNADGHLDQPERFVNSVRWVRR